MYTALLHFQAINYIYNMLHWIERQADRRWEALQNRFETNYAPTVYYNYTTTTVQAMRRLHHTTHLNENTIYI